MDASLYSPPLLSSDSLPGHLSSSSNKCTRHTGLRADSTPVWKFSNIVRLDKRTLAHNILPTTDPPYDRGHTQIEIEEIGKIFHANGNDKKMEFTILI